MTDPMAVGFALEQLRELIAILGELRNAGPRDQSFKQWRQVTLTLIQRVWPGEPARAAHFRNILFSAPTARADRAATREYYERGCSEATAYLEELALELEEAEVTRTPAAESPPAPSPSDAASPVLAGTAGTPPAPAAPHSAMPAGTPPAPAAPHSAMPAGTPPTPRPGRVDEDEGRRTDIASRPPLRLKDMLGFRDEKIGPAALSTRHLQAPGSPGSRTRPPEDHRTGDTTAGPAHAAPAQPAPSPAPTVPSRAAPPAPVPVQPAPSPAPTVPSRAARPAPAPAPAQPAPSPPASATRPAKAPPTTFAADRGEAPAAGPEATLGSQLDARLQEFESRGSGERRRRPRPATPTPPAQEVLSLAGMVEELGVPVQRRAIVRAALIDLGRQMDTPPIHWQTIRQALSFAMDHPQVARRVLPLLLPFLDEAA